MKFNKLSQKIGLGLFGIGVAALSIGLLTGGLNYAASADLNDLSLRGSSRHGMNHSGGHMAHHSEKQQLASFSRVDIDLDRADVTILPSDNGNAYLSYQANHELTQQIKQDTLVLRQPEKDRGISIDLSFLNGSSRSTSQTAITLFLPEGKELDTLHVDVDYGSISSQQIQARQAAYDLEVGTLTLDDHTVDSLSIGHDSGKITVKNSILQIVDIESDTGTLTFTDTTIARGEIETETGNIDLVTSDFANTSITTEIGNITTKQMTFTGKNSLESELGKMSLELTPDTLKQTHFSLQTETGQITAPNLAGNFNQSTFESDGNQPHRLQVRTETGAITIE